jgi:hypothetical protein
MPDQVLTELRRAGGPDLSPADAAYSDGLARLQREIADGRRRPRRRPRRGLRRSVALPAVGACAAAAALAAVALLAGTPGASASEVLERAASAVAKAPDILFVESRAQSESTDGEVVSYGTRRVWVSGDEMRWLNVTGGDGSPKGLESVTTVAPDAARGTPAAATTATYLPAENRIEVRRRTQQVPGEIFKARSLWRQVQAGKARVRLTGETTIDGRAAYVLRWNENSGPPHWPSIELTLWIDKETYAPLQFEDHSFGRDASGKPFDTTFTETVTRFERLPSTPENRKLLEMSPHPDAQR